MEPWLQQPGIAWDEELPILETIDTVAKIQQAIEDPEGFMQNLAAASRPEARKWALAKARPRMDSWLKIQGLAGEGVLPVLESIDTVVDIQQTIEDPEGFMQNLAARPRMEPWGGRSADLGKHRDKGGPTNL